MYGAAHVLRNNLEWLATGAVQMDAPVDSAANSWDLSLTFSEADFESVDPGELQVSYLRPTPTSPALDVGLDVGLPYNGAAPDLGAFEAP
jgi:hypothetical protein